MSPDVTNAIVTVITALVGAAIGWLAKRQPSPAPPAPNTPPVDPDRPVLKKLLETLLTILKNGAPLAPLILQEDAATPQPVVGAIPLTLDLGAHTVTYSAAGVKIAPK